MWPLFVGLIDFEPRQDWNGFLGFSIKAKPYHTFPIRITLLTVKRVMLKELTRRCLVIDSSRRLSPKSGPAASSPGL